MKISRFVCIAKCRLPVAGKWANLMLERSCLAATQDHLQVDFCYFAAMKWMRLLLLGICGPLCVWGQSPYRITKADIPIGIGAAAFAGVGYWAQSRVAPLTIAALSSQDPGKIPPFDRINVGDWRPNAAKASDIAVMAACASPLVLFAGKAERMDFPKIVVMGGEAGLISFGVVNTAKGVVQRTRPYAYGNGAPLEERLAPKARLSFFSGHTTFTATATFFAAQVYSDYHPDSKWKPLVWAGATLAPAAVAYLRVRAGKHFLSDVVTGYAVGAASGILVPILHRADRKQEVSMQPSFWGSGSGVVLNWRF